MEKARRKLRICLWSMVLIAVIVGVWYYYYEVRGNKNTSEGTLVYRSEEQYEQRDSIH